MVLEVLPVLDTFAPELALVKSPVESLISAIGRVLQDSFQGCGFGDRKQRKFAMADALAR